MKQVMGPSSDIGSLHTKANSRHSFLLCYLFYLSNIVLFSSLGDQIIANYFYRDDDLIDRIEYGNGTRVKYFYDDAGRINFIQHLNDNDGTTIYTAGYTLDVYSNILQQRENFESFPELTDSSTSSDIINYTYDNNNQIEDVNGVPYDVNDDGNTILIGSEANIQYDIEDRVTSYNDLDNDFDFIYNPYGQRISVVRNAVQSRYIRDIRTDNVLVLTNSVLSPNAYYIYSPSGQLIARMRISGGVDLHYYHGDIPGSVMAMTTDNGEITHFYRYDDFGQIKQPDEPAGD